MSYPKDFASTIKLIDRQTKAGIPLADDLHEHALHLGLASFPFDYPSTLSLIFLLMGSGRPPFPDGRHFPSEAVLRHTAVPTESIEDILQMVSAKVAEDKPYDAYAWLWQAVIRFPESPRPWAAFALRCAERAEWANARVAAEYALQHQSEPDAATVDALLEALATLAENYQLGSLKWETLFERLSADLRARRESVRFLWATGRIEASDSNCQLMLKSKPADFKSELVAGLVAYTAGRFDEAYERVLRAFEMDLRAAFPFFVGNYNPQFGALLERLNKIDEMAEWLTRQSANIEELNLVKQSNGQEYVRQSRRMRQVALEKGLPSVMLITQGKSGSTSIGRIFSSGFALPSVWYSLINLRVILPWARDYMRGGACYVTHLWPDLRNQALLTEAGATRLVVHVRDPRQILVSLDEHRKRYQQQFVVPELVSRREQYDEDPDLRIAEDFKLIVAWTAGWLEASKKMHIDFTTFEQFVADPNAFCDRLVSLYGGNVVHFDRAAAFEEQPNIDYHRRLGQTDEWRRRLTPRQIDHINALMPADFWAKFGWSP